MNYAVKRFIQLIPILFGITFLSFLLMYLAGSDAVTEMYTNRGVEVAQEIIDEKKAALGLNLPFFQAYSCYKRTSNRKLAFSSSHSLCI